MIFSLLLALAGAPVAVTTPHAEVELRGREIRLGDAAGLGGLAADARAQLAGRVLAKMPVGRSSMTVARAGLAGLIRRNVPGLSVMDGGGSPSITFYLPQPLGEAGRSSTGCVRLTRSLAAEEPIGRDDLVAVPCGDAQPSGLVRLDPRNGVARAMSSLEQGAYLGRLTVPPAPAVDAGKRLTLVANVGPVRVEREVVALQAGREGKRLFVRDEEGQVSSALLAPVSEDAR